jgi:hypothetical protein
MGYYANSKRSRAQINDIALLKHHGVDVRYSKMMTKIKILMKCSVITTRTARFRCRDT